MGRQEGLRLVLLSHVLNSNTPGYGNGGSISVEPVSLISSGSSSNSSRWSFPSNHLGTHVDVPRHFFENGSSITDFPPSFWFSDKIQLIDVPMDNAGLISIGDLHDEIASDTEVLLIRTGYERFRRSDKYWNENPGISAQFGFWVRENKPKIKMLGFDLISISSWTDREEGRYAHRAFLDPKGESKPIVIIEDMSLAKVTSQLHKILVAPLLVEDENGAPATIFGFL